MEITKDGIWVNPDVSVDDTAKAVINALDGYIKNFVERARYDEREACAKTVDHILKEGGGTYGDAIRARGEK
jgi:hypothetical protein